MKVGITLPQFRDDAGAAFDAAARAEASGLDGVFVFDHLWPIGDPRCPALAGPVLTAALAAGTERIAVGTLVARVGLLPDALLESVFATLDRMAGPRLVAGLGVGDELSRPENLAYGVPFRPRPERLAQLAGVCRRLRARGIATWVGGTSAATRRMARSEAAAVNLWGVEPAEVAEEVDAAAGRVEVTWAGQLDLARRGVDDVAELLRSVEAAGATWAVVAPVGAPWPEAVETIVAAAGSTVD